MSPTEKSGDAKTKDSAKKKPDQTDPASPTTAGDVKPGGSDWPQTP